MYIRFLLQDFNRSACIYIAPNLIFLYNLFGKALSLYIFIYSRILYACYAKILLNALHMYFFFFFALILIRSCAQNNFSN